MENEVIENVVTNNVNTENTQNTATDNTVADNNITNELAEDTLASTFAYYDSYYEQMLDKTDNVIENQELIIDNQVEQIELSNTIYSYCSVLIFLVSVFLIYYLLRNMINVK